MLDVLEDALSFVVFLTLCFYSRKYLKQMGFSFKENTETLSESKLGWYYPLFFFTFFLVVKNFSVLEGLSVKQLLILDICVSVVVLGFCKWKMSTLLSLAGNPLKTGLLSFVLFAPWIVMFFFGVYFVVGVFHPEVQETTDPVSEAMHGMVPFSFDFLMFLLIAVVIAPFFEEAIFRGIIQGYLRRYFNPVFAIALTSLVFAYLHVDNQLNNYFFLKMAVTFGFSFCVGLLMESKKSLASCVVFHGANNSIPFLIQLII